MTLTDLITALGLTEEQSVTLTDWLAARDSEHATQLRDMRAEHKTALADGIAAERAAQSRVLDAAQAEWDQVKTARDAALAELTGVRALAAKICNAAVETVNDESLTSEQVRATIVALCGEATKPAKVRELDAIKKQEAEIAAKKAALEAELSKQD